MSEVHFPRPGELAYLFMPFGLRLGPVLVTRVQVKAHEPTPDWLSGACGASVEISGEITAEDQPGARHQTDGQRLAIAVLSGDEQAALLLADEVQLSALTQGNFTPRHELIDLIRRLTEQNGPYLLTQEAKAVLAREENVSCG